MKRVGAVLGSMESRNPLHRRLAEARALEAWPDLVGPHLAKLTRPLRIAGGRLFVIAHGASLRQELMFHRRDILRKVNRAAEGTVAREMVFLESDANLSSLVQWDEAGTERNADAGRLAPPADSQGGGAAGRDRAMRDTTAENDDEAPRPYERVVPPFDAAAYRDEMARIASRAEDEHAENTRKWRK